MQSPLDSSFDISHISSTETSPFATPAREALSALRHTAKAAAEAGAPFSERALKEAEALVRSAEERAVASVSGGNTPKAVKLHLPPVDEADEAAGRARILRGGGGGGGGGAAGRREAETEATRARGNATKTTSRPMAFVRPPDTPGRDAEAFARVTANKENDVAWRREADSKKDDDSNAAATAATAADEEKTAAEVSACEAHVAESSPSSSAERVRRAEERYHRARERLRMAAAVSVSDSSAETSSPRVAHAARGRGNDDDACPSDAATASWSTTRAGGGIRVWARG